jgi:hypothetical protein
MSIEEESMQQPPMNSNEFFMTITTMARQLERLDERTRDLATRTDLEGLRKELVARESLEPRLNSLKAQIERVDKDRAEDRKEVDDRINKIETEQLSRQDRLWIRLTQAIAFAGFALALFEFLKNLHLP